jgi:hypothetical protein
VIGATGEVPEINSDAASAAEAEVVVVVQADRRVVTAGRSTNPVAPGTKIVDPARPVPVIVVMTAAVAVVAQAEAIARIAVLVRRGVVVAMTAVAVVVATVTGRTLSRLPLP